MDDNSTYEVAEGFVPIIRSKGDVSLREAGALAVVAGGSATLTEAGAMTLVAGGDATLRQAGAGTMIIGGSADIGDGGVGTMLVRHAEVKDSRVAILLAGSTRLSGSSVTIGTEQAVALGAAAGVAVFLLSRIFRRK